MVERPRLGLENPTHRARLRDVRRVFSELSEAPVKHGMVTDIHKHRNIRADGLPLAKATPLKITDITPHLPKQTKSRVLKRHMPKPDYRTYPKHKRPLIRTLTGITAVLLVSVGAIGTMAMIRGKRLAKAEDNRMQQLVLGSKVGTGDFSESEPPQNLSEHVVPADLPRFLVIDKIGLRARVTSVGNESKDTPSAPSNIFDVGWYTGSAKPGEPGATVIDGYVSGPTKRGAFYSIGNLTAGDQLEIERGDGKKFTYTITSTEITDTDKLDTTKLLASSEPGKSALNLITASGRFNVRTNRFEQRVVVYAVQN